MKKDSICVICENNHESWSVDFGTPISELVTRLGEQPHPVLAAMVHNRIKELSYRIYTPVTIRFIDATSFAGIRVLQRTAWFILQMAVGRCYPGRKLYIRHSMGQSGFYCEIEGIKHLTTTDTERLA